MKMVKRCLAVYVLSTYLLWPILPLVFGCWWGVGIGYKYTGMMTFPHGGIELPSYIWWLFTPVNFLETLLFDNPIYRSGVITFPGVSPCLKGYWLTFPERYAINGWLIAYAFCLLLSASTFFCKRSLLIFGKQRQLSRCLQVSFCAISFLSIFFCWGNGPYGDTAENEWEVVKLLEKGDVTPGEEKFGYRFVTEKSAVPLKYGWGNRARTLCKVWIQGDPAQVTDFDAVLMKDTEGRDEFLSGDFFYNLQTGESGAEQAYKLGWRRYYRPLKKFLGDLD